MAKNIIITGATSGLGRGLAVEMHRRGHTVGATGRRTKRLNALRDELGDRIYTCEMDVTKVDNAITKLESLIDEMGGMDIMVLNAGVSNFRGNHSWDIEQTVIDVNVRGFTALASFAYDYFERQEKGHIVGVSSIAGLFGFGPSSTYNASKAYVNNYLQGYRQRANRSSSNLIITDLQPGFVESEMTAGKKGMFWVATTKKAAKQMANAIESKKNHAYITRRWRLVAWGIKLIPNWIWNRI